MSVRNTGKVGFDFSIIYLPAGIDEEDGALNKATDDDRDIQQLKGNGKQQESLEIRPGCPIVIPSVVS